MKLTKERRKRIAKAARQLAYETAEGRGPQLDPYQWCGCAIGRAIKGAKEGPKDPWAFDEFSAEIDALLPGDNLDTYPCQFGLVSKATSAQVTDGIPGATVFPLLALADALEGKCSR